MIYRGFIITVRPTFGGIVADFHRVSEEYTTQIPRKDRFDAIQDACHAIAEILSGEQESDPITAEYDHIKEQWADYPRPWEHTE